MKKLDSQKNPAKAADVLDPNTPVTRVVEGRVVSAKRPVHLPLKEVPRQLTPYKPGQSGSVATQFKKGKSGNPTGRISNPSKMPITNAMRDMLSAPYTGNNKGYRVRNFTNAQALAATQLRLAIEMGDMRAAEELTNRTEGRVLSVTQLQGPDGGPLQVAAMTPEEKQARLEELLNKAGEGKIIDATLTN
jgi:hypothetical protein